MTEALARLTTRLADPPVSDPANPAAPPVLSQTAHVGWRDQVVIAVGLAQSFTDRLTAYGGFNYGRNPAPRDTLTPLLAPIGEYYVTGGLAYRITDGWAASGAFEYQLPKRVSYSNPNFPLSQDAEERTSYIALHLMLSRRW